MKVNTLSNTKLTTILKAFNLSFSTYFVPICLTLQDLKDKIKGDNIDLELSVGVFEDKELVAFILHGRKGNIVYNAGTGVIPSKRGNDLTKRMYDFILPKLKHINTSELLLEAITKNIPAIELYKKIGFIKTRTLLCYKGNVKVNYMNSNLFLKKLEQYDWKEMQRFWDVEPTWQYDITSLNKLKNQQELTGAYLNDKLVGYIIFNPKGKKIVQIAVDPIHRRKKIGSTLVANAILIHESLSVINVDQSSNELTTFFEYLGLENFISQIEMSFQLKTTNE